MYERNPETTEKKRLLQLNYEWQSDLRDLSLLPSFYRARYDGDRLLWQIDYVEGRIAYYSTCRYDTAGRLWEAVEYDAEGEKPEALFHRYEYPEENREEQYTYFMRGREFSHAFEEEDNVWLSFSEEGILSEMEMTTMSENTTASFAFYDSGENSGKLKRMRVGAEAAEGETAVLEKFEEEASAYGFQAGRDLNAGGAAQKEERSIWQ